MWSALGAAPEIKNGRARFTYLQNATRLFSLDVTHRVPIYLYGLTDDEANGPIAIDGFNVVATERLYMPCFYDIDKDLYTIIVWGDLTSEATPKVRLKTGIEPLTEFTISSGKTFSNVSKLNARTSNAASSPTSSATMPKSVWAILRASVERKVVWVSVKPAPLYECDSYDAGRWAGTLSVMRSTGDANAAKIVPYWH